MTHDTCNRNATCEGNMQLATRDMRHVIENMSHDVIYHIRHVIYHILTYRTRHATLNMQHTTCNIRHATYDMQCHMRHATCDMPCSHHSRSASRVSHYSVHVVRVCWCVWLLLLLLVCLLCALCVAVPGVSMLLLPGKLSSIPPTPDMMGEDHREERTSRRRYCRHTHMCMGRFLSHATFSPKHMSRCVLHAQHAMVPIKTWKHACCDEARDDEADNTCTPNGTHVNSNQHASREHQWMCAMHV